MPRQPDLFATHPPIYPQQYYSPLRALYVLLLQLGEPASWSGNHEVCFLCAQQMITRSAHPRLAIAGELCAYDAAVCCTFATKPAPVWIAQATRAWQVFKCVPATFLVYKWFGTPRIGPQGMNRLCNRVRRQRRLVSTLPYVRACQTLVIVTLSAHQHI